MHYKVSGLTQPGFENTLGWDYPISWDGKPITVNMWGHDNITGMSHYDAINVIPHWCHKDLTLWSITLWQHCDNTVTSHYSTHIISANHAQVTCVSNLKQLIHLSYFKTDTDYSKRNIIKQGIEGRWIWDIVHWISHMKPVLWVTDNKTKLQKIVRDCVRLWRHSMRTWWWHCDVMVWDLAEVITVMSLR